MADLPRGTEIMCERCKDDRRIGDWTILGSWYCLRHAMEVVIEVGDDPNATAHDLEEARDIGHVHQRVIENKLMRKRQLPAFAPKRTEVAS